MARQTAAKTATRKTRSNTPGTGAKTARSARASHDARARADANRSAGERASPRAGRAASGRAAAPKAAAAVEFKVQNVTIDKFELSRIIASLDDAIERSQRVKALCEEILTVQDQPRGVFSSSRPSRGASARHTNGARGPRRDRTLATVIREVLEKSKKRLRPGELRDRVLDAGYQTRAKPSSFYVSVFSTAKKIPGIDKTKAGFALPK